jgi:Bifunctional DNA primase/polymerase, N-terminal
MTAGTPIPHGSADVGQRVAAAGRIDVMTLADAALAYAVGGLAVLPLHRPILRAAGVLGCSCRDAGCRSIGKHPRTPHGLLDATVDASQVAAWWRRWPHANIGLATGGPFDVLDVDGPAGVQALRRLACDLHLPGPVVRTGGGGWHYWVAATGYGNAQPIRGLERVDWRGRGGYVVAPPSRHGSGARYRWLRPLAGELPQAPAALRELLAPIVPARAAPAPGPVASPRSYAQRVLADECASLAATASGGRNWRLWGAARNCYNFVSGGALGDDEVEAALLAAAAACGLLAEEPRQTRRTIQSGRRVGLAHPRGTPTLDDPAARGPVAIRAESTGGDTTAAALPVGRR